MDAAVDIWKTRYLTQYLTFHLADEEYAIDILRAREIVEPCPLTRVPSAPPFILGVMNLRGSVIPVVDLAAKLRLGQTSVSRWTCVVIVEIDVQGERVMMGLLADAAGQVVSLTPESIEVPPQLGGDRRMDHLSGMGRSEDKFILILDIDRALALSPGEVLS